MKNIVIVPADLDKLDQAYELLLDMSGICEVLVVGVGRFRGLALDCAEFVCDVALKILG